MYNRGNVRRLSYRAKGRAAQSLDTGTGDGVPNDGQLFLQIRPALPDPRRPFAAPRNSPHQRINVCDSNKDDISKIQAIGEGKVQISRTQHEKERLPDRICLDRRGLSSIPHIVNEPGLRLLSLQHNLINSLTGLAVLELSNLVFLDLYDNQIDKIIALDQLVSLRVLLLGKNRLRKMDGLFTVPKLEVLDLHGNRITRVGELGNLSDLKVLNLAGNQLRNIGPNDLFGLVSLKELNLKRNRLRKLLGFQHTPNLQKLYLGNNDLQSVEDVSSLAEAFSLTEISLDNNPVALGGDCTPFLVSYLPNLITLTSMHITEQVRAAAMAWRANKEAAHDKLYLGGIDYQTARRDQVINNARANWELLRSEKRSYITNINDNRTNDHALSFASGDSDLKNPLPDVVSLEARQCDSRKANTNSNDKKKTNKIQRCATAKRNEKRIQFSERSVSQDTDASYSTSSSEIKLPPILIPNLITSLENVKLPDSSEPILKRWGSISSMDPAVDSLSSLPSSSSDSEVETKPRLARRRFATTRSRSVCDPEVRKKKTKDVIDSSSNISTGTNVGSVTASSTSSNDKNVKTPNRIVRSATFVRRNERSLSASRAVVARAKSGKNLVNLKSSEPVQKSLQLNKDREQGLDYLVEIADNTVSAWGTGAIRRLSRDWDTDKARCVTHASFHYVNFNVIIQSFPELKNKFPNLSRVTFRATSFQFLGQLHALAELRGINSLVILPEGNPIHSKKWREYAIYRLSHWGLKEINNSPITDEEISTSNTTYQGLSDIVLRSLPDAPLQPLLSRLGRHSNMLSAKAWLRGADPSLREVIAKEALQYKKGNSNQNNITWRSHGYYHLSYMVELACGAAQRLCELELHWPTILVEMIEDALTDFSDMNTHMKEEMSLLMKDL